MVRPDAHAPIKLLALVYQRRERFHKVTALTDVVLFCLIDLFLERFAPVNKVPGLMRIFSSASATLMATFGGNAYQRTMECRNRTGVCP